MFFSVGYTGRSIIYTGGDIRLREESFYIKGMTCVSCESVVKDSLSSVIGVHSVRVDYLSSKATIIYDEAIVDHPKMDYCLKAQGYTLKKKRSRVKDSLLFIGIFSFVFFLSFIFKMFNTSSIVTSFPIAHSGMSYGMIFLIGVLTSLHCIAMCGGINLSQTINPDLIQAPRTSQENSGYGYKLIPAFLYNFGRVVSYTLIGVLIGSLGSVFTVSESFRDFILLVAGLFMFIMGMNMLGLFPFFRYFVPRFSATKGEVSGKKALTKSPLMVGILNGFMPCGPLQAMQLYALSTGSPIMGGISMFLFCIGTVPLMFLLGATGSILSNIKGRSFSKKIIQTGAILVASMGVMMVFNSMNLSDIFYNNRHRMDFFRPHIENGIQIVRTDLLSNRYPRIVVVKDIPVRWEINADSKNINGCNYRFSITEYKIDHMLVPGENIIDFLPTNIGQFSISCWMSMIHGMVYVIESEEYFDIEEREKYHEPAGVLIYLDQVKVANLVAQTLYPSRECEIFQEVRIVLDEDGFEPAIIVVQKDVPLRLSIDIVYNDPGNLRIICSGLKTIFETQFGNNILEIHPTIDFDFSTSDHIFYGFVKVVDDLENIDIEAIKDDVFEHETMIYPEDDFETIKKEVQ